MKGAAVTLTAAMLALSAASSEATAAESGVIVPQPGPLTWLGNGFDSLFASVLVPSPGTPWYSYVLSPAPRVGCYFARYRINNAWRRVEVCY